MLIAHVLDRDAIVSQLCAVIVPPIFIYTILMHFFGGKLANWLLRKDSYNEKKIKLRMYGILRVTCICMLFIFLIVYFAFCAVWDMVVFFGAVLSGYAWIKLRTCSARLEYTYRHLIFCTRKKQDRFSWEDVMQMSWVTQRGSVAYLLKIQLRTGLTATLSSNDFVGLTKLKSFYDERYYKQGKTGNGLV